MFLHGVLERGTQGTNEREEGPAAAWGNGGPLWLSYLVKEDSKERDVIDLLDAVRKRDLER